MTYETHYEFADRMTPRDNWCVKDSRYVYWFINALYENETSRHCRIGRITLKVKA